MSSWKNNQENHRNKSESFKLKFNKIKLILKMREMPTKNN